MRKYAAVALLALLTVSAGCSSPLASDPITDEKLTRNVDSVQYDWDTDAAATLTLQSKEYRSVYRVSPDTLENASQMEVYNTNAFAMERPIPIETLKFRYENGTVITTASGPGHERFYVTDTRERATIHFPADRGQVAFVAPKSGKSMDTPVFLAHSREEGPSYEVVLPPETDAAVPLLSSVRPGGYERTRGPEDRVHLRWNSVTVDHLSVRYYLDRDLLLFGSLAGVLVVVGLVGALYYLRQIRELERRREEVGIDIETEDRP